MVETTVIYPDPVRGQVRPYGYGTYQVQTGAGSKTIGIQSDTKSIGVQVDVITPGSYFVEGTVNPTDMVIADTATWYDLFGDGVTPQTTGIQFSIDPANLSAIRLRVVTGKMAISYEGRRT